MGDGMHASERDMFNYQLSADFDAIDEDLLVGGGGVTNITTDACTENDSSSMFYGVATSFPPLPPDFPCMSSTSSSSSTPAPPSTMMPCSSTSSSSATSSWAVLKSDGDEDEKPQAVMMDQPPPTSACLGGGGGGDVACMDVMETFGYMDLMEESEIWDDPSSIFSAEFQQAQEQQQQQLLIESFSQPLDESCTMMMVVPNECGGGGDVAEAEGGASEDLAAMFFEWLKTNKESISAEELRSIRLKRSTIECAARRLGGGREGMKRLLKLILEWVQNHQLHRQQKMPDKNNNNNNIDSYQFHNINIPSNPTSNTNPTPNLNFNSSSSSSNSTNTHVMVSPPPPPDQTHPWSNIPPPMIYGTNPAVGDPGFPSMGGYMEPFNINGNPNYPPSNDYHLDTAKTWPFDQVQQFTTPYPADNHIPTTSQPGYGNQYTYQYFPGNGEKLVRLGSSATKEARQKRMARQRRLLSHNRHIHNHHTHNQNHLSQVAVTDQHANGTQVAANWFYWPNTAAAPPPPHVSSPPTHVMQPDAPVQTDRAQSQNYQRHEKRQGGKSEKNLKFLLQKVLKQSDVGNLGRIVLPKKEAETHLPELDARDGITIPMEDIATSRVWNMRYRFWPNNKSRMYLLENTGEFVRSNGLQEGDFIVIYSDVKCGKYMIRGVKVRQPGQKPEIKKSGKGNKHHHNKTNMINEMRNFEKNSKATALTNCMNMDV